MYTLLLTAITAFIVTYVAIPSIISVSKKKGLFDTPGGRKIHTEVTPSLGGLGIFAGAIFAIIFWTPFKDFGSLQYILCAFVIMFLIGLKDDISPVQPAKKLIAQVIVALILIFKSNILISSLYGLMGVNTLPEYLAVPLTIFMIVLIINSVNLIDGINGLAGSVTALITGTLGLWFYVVDNMGLAIISFAMLGSVIAFLKYNLTPAKIFMGDTGSLILGTACAVLVISFMEDNLRISGHIWSFKEVPAIAVAILLIPLFDTSRVFIRRTLKGKSPFNPDRSHLHHILLDLGFNHLQSTGILIVANITFITLAIVLQPLGSLLTIIIMVSLALIVTYLARTRLSKDAASL